MNTGAYRRARLKIPFEAVRDSQGRLTIKLRADNDGCRTARLTNPNRRRAAGRRGKSFDTNRQCHSFLTASLFSPSRGGVAG